MPKNDGKYLYDNLEVVYYRRLLYYLSGVHKPNGRKNIRK